MKKTQTMDYVGVDGKPAGFNAALLSAICDYLKMPIEVICVTA